MGDSHVGLQARMMSQAMRKLAGTLNRTDTICIFTNQLREKIGVMFGNPETTPGGRALKFYASVRLDIRRIETLKEGVEAIGNRVRVKVAKNKVAPPFKLAEFDILYGQGISWEGTVLDAGLERKVVQKSGSYFSFEDERLGQGRQNATAFLREHPDVTDGIVRRIQEQLGDDQIASARLLPVADARRPGDCGEEEGRRCGGRAPTCPARTTRPASRGRGAGRGIAVTDDDERRRALDRSIRALARRDHSAAALRAKLDRAGYLRRLPRRDASRPSSGSGTSTTSGSPATAPRRLAERGYGDEWIRADLEARASTASRRACAGGSQPELERAARETAKAGGGLRAVRTARAARLLGGDAGGAVGRAVAARPPEE